MNNQPLVNRSWFTYHMDKNGNVRMILHVEPRDEIAPGTLAESELATAIREFMEANSEIDHAEVEPRVR